MSCESETAELLRAQGHKLTPQRLLILSALRHGEGHYTAQDIHERVKERYPYVDVSTVYRTLTVLKRMRLVAETDMGSGDYTYEWIGGDRHHHLVRRRCASVQQIDDDRLESLAEELMERHGFAADLDHFAIFGLCRACQEGRQEAS